jgi:hypothetical protein
MRCERVESCKDRKGRRASVASGLPKQGDVERRWSLRGEEAFQTTRKPLTKVFGLPPSRMKRSKEEGQSGSQAFLPRREPL